MSILAEVLERLRTLVFRVREERDMDEELRFHVQMQTEANLRAGMNAENARRQALIAIGGVERYKEEWRDARGMRWLDDLGRDTRYALRRLAKQRAFSLPVVLTLALGIGASSAIFALVDGVLLRPLPYPEPGRLVAIRHTAPGLGVTDAGLSGGIYLHYRKYNRVFESVGLYTENNLLSITEPENPEQVQTAFVTPSMFTVLKTSPFLGRLFTSDDARPNSSSVLLSYGLWVRRYGADPGIVGRTIELNRTAHEIIGVLPPDFDFPRPETQLWYAMPVDSTRARVSAGALFGSAIARLKPGVSPEDAQVDLQRLIPSLADAFPDVTPDDLRRAQLHAVVIPLKDAIVGDARAPLVILLCAVAFVLLIAWANVINLFLVRGERLQQEVAVARALGATGRDLARRFLSENVMLASLSGALGLVLAYAAVASRFGFQPGQIPRLHEVHVGGVVIAVTIGLSMVSALLLGSVSLLKARRTECTAALKGTPSRMSGGRRWQRAQRSLVAIQVAIALTLVIGSAMMVQSFWRLKQAKLGFSPRSVLTFELPLPYSAYSTDQAAGRFHRRFLERLRAIPGVSTAEEVMLPPLSPLPSYLNQRYIVAGQPSAREERLPAAWGNIVTAGYFRAMGIPLLRGRTFEPDDARRKSPAVVISAALARALFPDADPIGRQLQRAGSTDSLRYTVVGVVGNVSGETIAGGEAPMLYARFFDHPQINMMSVVVRSTLPPTSLVAPIRRLVHELDPKIPIIGIRTMDQIVAASMARARLMMLLLLVAGGVALLLGVIGLYGLLAYTVSLRTAELGIRIALGASPTAVTRMVVHQGVQLALVGIATGLLAALGLTRFLGSLLYEVSPSDPGAFIAMAAVLFAVALLASYVPARRAGRIDPVRALKGG